MGLDRPGPSLHAQPSLCAFLGQPSAATRPRCLRRNCQIKMNHLAHNGRGAYLGRAGPRRRLISAAHTAGANEAAGGSGIRARGWARAGEAQHGHARTPGRKNVSIPAFFPGTSDSHLPRNDRPFLRSFPVRAEAWAPSPGVLLPPERGGGTFHAAFCRPSRWGDSLPSFPLSPCAIDRKAQGAGDFHCFWAVCAGGRVESVCVSGGRRWLLSAWAFGDRSCAGV